DTAIPPVESEREDSDASNASPGQSATGPAPLDAFLSGIQDLTVDERLVVVDAAITMLSQGFVHLPLKRSMHGIEPIQRLRLLRQRVDAHVQEISPVETARGFHDEMISIFHSLRDLHTNYVLPSSYQGRSAFLPFLVQEYFEGEPPVPRYIVTKVLAGFVHDTFKIGVTVT